MKRSETSDRMSSVAGAYAQIQAEDIQAMSRSELVIFAACVRSMAASLLRQDETKGLRRLARKVLGR